VAMSEERFRRSPAASSYGLAMGDLSGQLVFGNAAVLRIAEEDREEDFGRQDVLTGITPR